MYPGALDMSTCQTSGVHACIKSRSPIAARRHALDSIHLPDISGHWSCFCSWRFRRCTTNVDFSLASCIPAHSTVPSTLRRAGVYRVAEPDCSTARSIPYPSGGRNACFTPRERGEYDDLPPTSTAICLSCIPIPSTMRANLRRVSLCRAAEVESSMICAIPSPCRGLSRPRSFFFNSREGHG